MPRAIQPLDELIELRGLRFHYRVWDSGHPDLENLVLLHGFTGHARSWDVLARAMCNRYRIFALDQRGHGETAWAPDAAYDTDEMVQDLQAFVRALNLAAFHLLGLSMGGIVAFHYAGTRPSELQRLVIVDIAPRIQAVGVRQIHVWKRPRSV